MNKLIVAFVGSLIVAGCAIQPTKDEIAAADYGAPPTDHRTQIENYFSSSLKDPESVRYGEISEPRKGHASIANRWSGWSNVFGYHVDASINAKNSYGGYTGYKRYSFLFRDGKLIQVVTPQ